MATEMGRPAFIIAACFLFSLSAYGQMVKNAGDVRGGARNLWSTLSLDAISPRGNFIACRLHYQDGTDTLFVKDARRGNVAAIAKGREARFIGEHYLACSVKGQGVILLDLKKDARLIFPLAEAFSVSAGGRHIAVSFPGPMTERLLVRELSSGSVLEFSDVSEWSMDPAGKSIAVASGKELWLVQLGKKLSKKNIASGKATFSDIAWHESGSSFAFCTKGAENKIFHYGISQRKLSSVNSSLYGPLHVSHDGRHVYFGKQKPTSRTVAGPALAEVWNTMDIHIFPEREQLGDPASHPDIAIWNLDTGKIAAIGDVGASFLFSPAGLLFTNFTEIGNQGAMFQQRDFYTADPDSGERILWLRSHGASLDMIAVDPDGRYAAYEKDGEVFAYDFGKKKHMRIGKGSLPEWKAGSAKLQFVRGADLWEASPEDGKAKRMTAGEEKNIVLRPYSGNILEAASKDGSLAGYYRTDGKGGELPLAFGEFHASQLLQADSSGAYAYVRQRFDSPPEIMYGFLDAGEPASVFRSNPHFKKEEWGRAERITYEGRDGKPLAGVLVYPAGYDLEKRYPMVVNIYEAQARHLHRFSIPSLRNYSGFSASLLANSGYFVLRPDIAYGKDSFDKSALSCVTAAVARACEVAPIDPERIGLMGHSFGGTQASLLASRTGIFATVIAGAGNSNLTGRYLSWSANNKRAEYWRFESGQNFMGGRTLFEDMGAYIKNSSALMAESITAPMLIWTGSEDRQVPPVDSEALYLALRRLGKPGVMLKYKNEGHAIMAPQAQEDLTRKVMEWLGHYLKGEKVAGWMLPAAEGAWR